MGERHPETGVDGTEHNGVGHNLDKVGLAGRQGQQNARRQEDEKHDGDNNVHIHFVCIYRFKNISQQHHNLMVKALANLTARVVCLHRDMTPLIGRIHSGFMVERSLQAVEEDMQKMQEMLREVRQTLKAPKQQSHDFIPMK